MTREIDNSQDYIDVRDVIERFEELRDEYDALATEVDEAREANLAAVDHSASQDTVTETAETQVAAEKAMDDWDETDEGQEYNRLKSLLDELSGSGGDHQWRGDWYPVSLIRDSHFNDAMDELLEDTGDLPRDLPSYLTITVDYDALQMDYSSVEFDGVTYWYR